MGSAVTAMAALGLSAVLALHRLVPGALGTALDSGLPWLGLLVPAEVGMDRGHDFAPDAFVELVEQPHSVRRVTVCGERRPSRRFWPSMRDTWSRISPRSMFRS